MSINKKVIVPGIGKVISKNKRPKRRIPTPSLKILGHSGAPESFLDKYIRFAQVAPYVENAPNGEVTLFARANGALYSDSGDSSYENGLDRSFQKVVIPNFLGVEFDEPFLIEDGRLIIEDQVSGAGEKRCNVVGPPHGTLPDPPPGIYPTTCTFFNIDLKPSDVTNALGLCPNSSTGVVGNVKDYVVYYYQWEGQAGGGTQDNININISHFDNQEFTVRKDDSSLTGTCDCMIKRISDNKIVRLTGSLTSFTETVMQ